MEHPKKGQRITVQFSGIVTAEADPRFRVTDADGHEHLFWPGSRSVNYVVEDPDFWPPQVGDVWKTDTGLYYARKSVVGESVLLWPFRSSGSVAASKFIQSSPVLAFRDGAFPVSYGSL
jgi:hypothetical protein